MAEASTPAKADKPSEKASDIALSSDPSKDRSKPSRPDHGKAPKWVEDQEKARKEAEKDPWGLTPAQSREPAPETKGTASYVDGLNPHLDGNEHIVGGTLPPV
jgi:hypothetical protein